MSKSSEQTVSFPFDSELAQAVPVDAVRPNSHPARDQTFNILSNLTNHVFNLFRLSLRSAVLRVLASWNGIIGHTQCVSQIQLPCDTSDTNPRPLRLKQSAQTVPPPAVINSYTLPMD